MSLHSSSFFFFFSAPPPTEIYTLSLHDALPISGLEADAESAFAGRRELRAEAHLHGGLDLATDDPTHRRGRLVDAQRPADRKSTRLNSSHVAISYAVFCLKKKIKTLFCLLITIY